MIIAIIIILIFISIIDVIFHRIPDWLNILLFIYAIMYVLWNGMEECLFGLLIGLVIFIIAYLLSKGSLGEGDIKLIPSLGLIIGFQGVLKLIFGSALLSLIVFILNKKRKAQVLPYAPFLTIVFLFIIFLQSSSF